MFEVTERKFACARNLTVAGALVAVLGGCASAPEAGSTDVSSALPQGVVPASELDWRKLPAPDHTLANFQTG